MYYHLFLSDFVLVHDVHNLDMTRYIKKVKVHVMYHMYHTMYSFHKRYQVLTDAHIVIFFMIM